MSELLRLWGRRILLVGALCSWLASTGASAGTEELSFDDALARIIERSPTVASQRQILDSVRAGNLPARLFYLPELLLDAQGSTKRVNSLLLEGTSRQIEAQASWNLLRFGADLAGLRAARASERREEAILSSSVLKAEDDGAFALIDLIRKRMGLQVLQSAVDMQAEALAVARRRYDHGLLPLEEAQKSEIDLENARSRLAEGAIAAQAAASNLQAQLGTSDIRIEWPWKMLFLKMDPAAFVRRHPFEVQDLPDWKSATELVESTDQQAIQNYRTMLPSVDAKFDFGYYNLNDPIFGSEQSSQWVATLDITFPVFDRLVNYSKARALVYQKAAAESERILVERNALGEYSNQRQSLVIAVQSAVRRETTLLASRRLYQASLRRFREGRATSNDLLLDETRLTSSQDLANQGWAAAHQALVRYCHSLGLRLASCGLAPGT